MSHSNVIVIAANIALLSHCSGTRTNQTNRKKEKHKAQFGKNKMEGVEMVNWKQMFKQQVLEVLKPDLRVSSISAKYDDGQQQQQQ